MQSLRRRGWRRLADDAAWALRALVDPAGRTRLRHRWQRAAAGSDAIAAYARWCAQFGTAPSPTSGAEITVAVLLPVHDPAPDALRAALDSVLAQSHAAWQLCIADDASTAPHVARVLAEYADRDPRIVVTRRAANGHISAATNSALALATAEFVALLDHDDLLHPHALAYVAAAIAAHPDANLVYTDEDRLYPDGRRGTPYFKPDFDSELLLAQNLVSHLGCYRTALVRELGGFREGFEGSQDWDLALRVVERSAPGQVVHVPRVLYHWRVAPQSTAADMAAKPYAREAGRRAVREHLARTGVAAEVVDCPELPSANRVRFALPQPAPACTIVVPTRDNGAMLARCLDGLQRRTDYPDLRVLVVDNGSRDAATLAVLARAQRGGTRVLRADLPFNFARLNNLAVESVDTPFVCLLNDDVEPLAPDWLATMVATASRPDVGVVGARLWYPDGTLQHAGIVLGIADAAGHPHKGLPRGEPGYFGRAVLQQQFSAVTAACMLVRTGRYREVGGMDESFPVAYNDVDFCLRVRAAGQRIVWAPGAELQHHESATRGTDERGERYHRLAADRARLRERWGSVLERDPAYSPCLTLQREDMSLAWPSRAP